VVAGPEVDVDSVENRKQGKSPCNSVNDNRLASREELIDDGAEEKKMDHRPAWRLATAGKSEELEGKTYQMANAQGAGVI